MNQRFLLTSIFMSFALTTCVWQPAKADGPCKACQSAAHHHCHRCDHHDSHQCCPSSAPCCHDARICIRAGNAPGCYSEAGVRAFMTLFRAAAEKGVENAAIRAFNATTVAKPCEVCGQASDRDDHDDHKHGDDNDEHEKKRGDDDRRKKGDQDKKRDSKK